MGNGIGDHPSCGEKVFGDSFLLDLLSGEICCLLGVLIKDVEEKLLSLIWLIYYYYLLLLIHVSTDKTAMGDLLNIRSAFKVLRVEHKPKGYLLGPVK